MSADARAHMINDAAGMMLLAKVLSSYGQEVSRLKRELAERDDLIVQLQHQARELRHEAKGWQAKYQNEKALRARAARGGG